MTSALHQKLIAALLAPALLLAGGAQGFFFMRCGEQARMSMSCCCPAAKTPAPETTLTQAKGLCCDTLAVPSAPVQVHEVAASAAPVPVLFAVATAPHPAMVSAPRAVREAPSVDPPQSASIVLSNCALLI